MYLSITKRRIGTETWQHAKILDTKYEFRYQNFSHSSKPKGLSSALNTIKLHLKEYVISFSFTLEVKDKQVPVPLIS